MLRLPLVLVSAIAGVMLVVGLAYALPENPGASGGGIPKKAQLAQRNFWLKWRFRRSRMS